MSASLGSSCSTLQPHRQHTCLGAVRHPARRTWLPLQREPFRQHAQPSLVAIGALPASGGAAKAAAANTKGQSVGAGGKWKAPETKEAHKIFDEVFIVVKGGDGGQGEMVESKRGRWVDNFKYKPGGNQPKRLWLPASEPADGADGADVVLVCDPAFDNLLHLHARKQYSGPKGSNGNPSAGSSGPKRNKDIKKALTEPFEIPVPPGTVVKRKSTGTLLGELINPGDRLVVAKGGRGGVGVVVPSKETNVQKRNKQLRKAEEAGMEVVQVEDQNWKLDASGMPGQQMGLTLLLRVVADVGIVGFPNAGKSSLLRSMTNAAPDIAPYPFTTLMPNLGVLASGGDKQTVLADLPGLIEGAHEGKGLGRMFLRHLRRTNVLLHVVDASAPDPATDYLAVREELRMYNPEYCGRPHVVVLNKIDLLEGQEQVQQVVRSVLDMSVKHCTEWSQEKVKPLVPAAVVAASAASGDGLAELNTALGLALKPECPRQLSSKGIAATQVLLPPLLPSHDGAAEAGTNPQILEFYNSKVQGVDAWVGGRLADERQGPADGEELEEHDPTDPEDAWMLTLSESQLAVLAEQENRRRRQRAAAARAAGADPDAGEQTAQGSQAGQQGAGAATGSTQAVEESADEDEWVELTEEELKLLEFLDKCDEDGLAQLSEEELLALSDQIGAQAAQVEGQVQGEDEGESESEQLGPIDPEDEWLFKLSVEEMLALADKTEERWEASKEKVWDDIPGQ